MKEDITLTEDEKPPLGSIPSIERRRLIKKLSRLAVVAPAAIVLTTATVRVAFAS